MRVGLTLAGDRLDEDGAGFAAEPGVTDVVADLTNHASNGDRSARLAGRAHAVGSIRAPVLNADFPGASRAARRETDRRPRVAAA